MGLKSQKKVGAPWNNLAHGRGQVWAVVNTVMNHRAPQNARNFLIRYGNFSVSPGFCFVEVIFGWLCHVTDRAAVIILK